MERFFILDKFNTWYDWKLVLVEKDITPPEPKTNYVDIDGMSGSLDLSESLTGEVTYKDRTVSASFWTCEGTRSEREKLLRTIVSSLQGKKIKIIEPDDPDHYFYGRVIVKSMKNVLAYSEFVIEATCEPWRYAVNDTIIQFDPSILFTNDVVIRNNGVKTVCPVIETNVIVTIMVGDTSIELYPGTYKITDLKLRQGVNVVRVKYPVYGNREPYPLVTFTYKEADL